MVVCSRSLWLRSPSAVRSSRLPTLLCAVLFSSVQAVLQSTHYVLADGLAARWPSYQVRLDKARPSGSLPSHCTGRLLVYGTNLLWGSFSWDSSHSTTSQMSEDAAFRTAMAL